MQPCAVTKLRMQSSFLDIKGLLARNLKYIRKFVEAYPDFEFVPTIRCDFQLFQSLRVFK